MRTTSFDGVGLVVRNSIQELVECAVITAQLMVDKWQRAARKRRITMSRSPCQKLHLQIPNLRLQQWEGVLQ